MKYSMAVANGKGGVGKSNFSNQISAGIVDGKIVAHDSTSNSSFINEQRLITSKKQNIIPTESPLYESFEKTFDEDGTMTEAENFEIIWNHMKTVHEGNVIFDLGGYDSPDHRVIYANADIIIVPTGLSLFDLQSLRTMNSYFKQVSKIAKRKIVAKVLPNRIHHKTKQYKSTSKKFIRLVDEVSKYEHLELMESIITERSEYEESIEKGCSVLELKETRRGTASREIKAVINELNLPKTFK